MIAINVFISAMTESQVVAAVLGMGVGLLISMMSYFVSLIDVEWIKTVLEKISFLNYYQNFTIGILSFTDVIFFLSVTALFLFFTVRALEKRRWS
jgi:ABC-2 type transport system permease protein